MPDDNAKLLITSVTLEQFLCDFPSQDDAARAVQVFRAVRFLAQRMNEATTQWLSPFGVSATKYNYLAVLHVNRHRGLTATELGNSVRTTSGSVTTMLHALEREGLVARHGHPTDGRSVVIKPTARGSKLYVRSAEASHKMLVEVLASFGPDNAQLLLDLLVRAGNALHEIVGREGSLQDQVPEPAQSKTGTPRKRR
jgi:DNA-binding MarR family transcriptional regulator